MPFFHRKAASFLSRIYSPMLQMNAAFLQQSPRFNQFCRPLHSFSASVRCLRQQWPSPGLVQRRALGQHRLSGSSLSIRNHATLHAASYTADSQKYFEPLLAHNDTIFALSSGPGVTAGVAVIRVSGPAALTCLAKLLGVDCDASSSGKQMPRARYASLRKLYHPSGGELLDEAIVILFPGPRSFTGEDVVEFHVHGSRAVINGVIDALGSVRGSSSADLGNVRPAERGEFTRRAFENGRMDLTEVEGLADLISAETAMQREQALRQLGGEVRDLLEGWREEIKNCLAHAEAVIDFGDDVDDDAFEAIVPRIDVLCQEMTARLNDRHRGEIVRGGARVAIVGEPNAGKSTLLNALVKRPAAIVSAQAGTTRDVVEVQLDLNGLAVVVSDTAGLRDQTNDPIEIEGMKRARDVATRSDVTILVHDASRGGLEKAVKSFPSLMGITEGERTEDCLESDLICVASKIDLLADKNLQGAVNGVPVFEACLLKNEGITEVTKHLEKVLKARIEGVRDDDHSKGSVNRSASGNMPIITRARHRHHMREATCALKRFVEGRSGEDRELHLPMDLATEDLRIAARELGAITGSIHTEEVLDVIFSEFCIGK